MNPRAFIAHGHRPAAILVGLVVITAAVASVAPRPVPLPPTDPPIDPRSANKVTNFANDHPEFAPLRDGRKDASLISLNHAKHMVELAGTDDMKARMREWTGEDRPMRCTDCHVPDTEGRSMLPVTFEQHCRSCHAADLGKIEVAPGVVPAALTPHGDPGLILDAVNAQTLEWIAAAPRTTEPEKPAEDAKPAGGRRRGGGRDAEPEQKKTELPNVGDRAKIDAFLIERRDEAMKKFRTSCSKCHSIERPETKGSPFVVKNPHIPDQWLPRSIFSHAAHMMVSCTSCHDVEKSSSTSDINLPDIASCRECHSPRSASLASAGIGSVGANGAGDSCVMCHVYHPKGGTPMEGKLKPKDLLRD